MTKSVKTDASLESRESSAVDGHVVSPLRSHRAPMSTRASLGDDHNQAPIILAHVMTDTCGRRQGPAHARTLEPLYTQIERLGQQMIGTEIGLSLTGIQ